jgi:predicted amidohydrolase YtcJ
VIDDPELVLYPAFHDTHNHQLLAARDLDYVSLEQARSIGELVQALREAAERLPAGEWIISSRCWHETHPREGRLPTARELDVASAGHPVFVPRGGHVGVANSAALRLAGITATSADPASGTVIRLPDRTPTGVLIEPGALDPLLSIWGLVTRGTRTVGVQGPEYRVDVYTAIRLYTEAGGRLLREERSVGILAPGAFADVVGFRGDLLDCPVDDLPSRQPVLTLVGGRPAHDPEGLCRMNGETHHDRALRPEPERARSGTVLAEAGVSAETRG